MVALGLRVVGALFAAFEPRFPKGRRSLRPLGCHRRRIAGRDVFEAVVFRLVTGCSWDVAGRLGRRGEATLRNRYNEWNADGAFDRLAAEAVGGHDRIVGVDLAEASVDASIHKAPCGASRKDATLLEPTSAAAPRGLLADVETLHLDRGYSGIPVLETRPSHGTADAARAKKRPSNFGQPRRSTDRNTKARLGQLALAIAMIITVKLFKWADR